MPPPRENRQKNQEQHLRERIIHFAGLTMIRQPAEMVKELVVSGIAANAVPSLSIIVLHCGLSGGQQHFSTSAFCHEPFHPIAVRWRPDLID